MASHLVRGYVNGLSMLKVIGGTPKVGEGLLYTYTIYAERGLDLDKLTFGHTVDSILADPRGWTRGGKVAFQRVNRNANTQIVIASPDTVDTLCFPLKTEGKVSCCVKPRVVINIDRWINAVPHWDGSVRTYRQMLINHEVGHRIGQDHRQCPGKGKRAPVMQQQTLGLQGCKRNSWPLASEL